MGRIIITTGALAVGVVHLVWPALTIDAITLALIGIGILPWIAPSIQRIVQSIDIPGVGKVELREAKETAEAALSRAEEVEKKLSEREKQSLIDAQALALLERATEDLDDPSEQTLTPEDLQELKKRLKEASRSVKVIAFVRARNLRRLYKRKPRLAERSIPIFEALIESDHSEEFHRNHGQLGYILKDKKEKEYQRALEELSNAIRIRDRVGDVGFEAYEFNRAVCRIATDHDFKQGERSSSRMVREILADLRRAAESRFWQEAIKRPPAPGEKNVVLDWLRLNDIDPDTLEPK